MKFESKVEIYCCSKHLGDSLIIRHPRTGRIFGVAILGDITTKSSSSDRHSLKMPMLYTLLSGTLSQTKGLCLAEGRPLESHLKSHK